jgi:hypothetical protein
VGMDSVGHLAVSGYFEPPLSFGSGVSLSSNGDGSAFTVMFGPP